MNSQPNYKLSDMTHSSDVNYYSGFMVGYSKAINKIKTMLETDS